MAECAGLHTLNRNGMLPGKNRGGRAKLNPPSIILNGAYLSACEYASTDGDKTTALTRRHAG